MYQNYYERTLSIRYFDVAHRILYAHWQTGSPVLPWCSITSSVSTRSTPWAWQGGGPQKHTVRRPRREALSTARYSLYSHVGWVKPFWCTIASTGSPRYCGVIHTFCWGVYVVSHQLFSQWVSAWWTTETRLNSAYFYPSLLRSKAGNNAIFHELG